MTPSGCQRIFSPIPPLTRIPLHAGSQIASILPSERRKYTIRGVKFFLGCLNVATEKRNAT